MEKYMVALVCLLGHFIAPNGEAVHNDLLCPQLPGWNDPNCYQYMNKSTSWNQSLEICHSTGGNLFEYPVLERNRKDSVNKASIFKILFRKEFYPEPFMSWIGAITSSLNGITVIDWLASKAIVLRHILPMNMNSMKAQCLAARIDEQNGTERFQIVSYPCSDSHYFVCQYNRSVINTAITRSTSRPLSTTTTRPNSSTSTVLSTTRKRTILPSALAVISSPSSTVQVFSAKPSTKMLTFPATTSSSSASRSKTSVFTSFITQMSASPKITSHLKVSTAFARLPSASAKLSTAFRVIPDINRLSSTTSEAGFTLKTTPLTTKSSQTQTLTDGMSVTSKPIVVLPSNEPPVSITPTVKHSSQKETTTYPSQSKSARTEDLFRGSTSKKTSSINEVITTFAKPTTRTTKLLSTKQAARQTQFIQSAANLTTSKKMSIKPSSINTNPVILSKNTLPSSSYSVQAMSFASHLTSTAESVKPLTRKVSAPKLELKVSYRQQLYSSTYPPLSYRESTPGQEHVAANVATVSSLSVSPVVASLGKQDNVVDNTPAGTLSVFTRSNGITLPTTEWKSLATTIKIEDISEDAKQNGVIIGGSVGGAVVLVAVVTVVVIVWRRKYRFKNEMRSATSNEAYDLNSLQFPPGNSTTIATEQPADIVLSDNALYQPSTLYKPDTNC